MCLAVLAIASVIFVLVSMNLAGIFCGFTLGVIFLVPTFFGLACGVLLAGDPDRQPLGPRLVLPLVRLADRRRCR